MINNFLETNDTPVSHLASTNELGSELRRLREQKGLSIKEVADRLKLPARQIEALENGLYEGLPEPVFIRGFLRSYGRFLDMDEQRLTSYLDHIAPSTTKPRISEQHDLNFANSTVKKSSPKWIFAVIALAIIGAGVYFWQMKSNQENEAQENISTIPVENAEASASNLNTDNLITKPMTPSDTATQTAVASAVMNQNNQAVNNTPTASKPSNITPVAGELVISTKHRTMLTVTNVNGKVVMNKIVPAASEYRFKEGAPFEVRMGYAEGATATFAGQAIDLEAQQKDGKSVAFTAGGQ